MKNKKILVGTSKGLVIFERKEKGWKVKEVFFLGFPVSTVYVNELTGTWWAGVSHRHWGQKLHFSNDQGTTWDEVAPPKYPSDAKLSNGKIATLKKIWSLHHGGVENPESLWVGTEPGGLFFSEKNGQDLKLINGLWNHPSRSDQNQWFGAGRDHPFIHSIVVDPRDSQHVYIAVSCAGVFETKDGGTTWHPRNNGLVAAYLPNPNVEIGHDPHLLLQCKAESDVLWQQNHCGIFRSTNGGATWNNVTDNNGIANYGFALAIDDENPLRAWVIPAISDGMRVAHDLTLTVCRTEDGGETWESLTNGLPQEYCFDIVFRHSLAIDGSTLVFGTTTGNLYLSENNGDDWECVSSNLARVEGVVFSNIEH